MRVYLIHDVKRTDRHKLFMKEIEEQEIGVEIMPAVKEYTNVRKNISEAHKNCIREAIDHDLDKVVVLEDDVRFVCQGAYKRFLELSGQLPEDWDVFTAGSYDYIIQRQGGTQYPKEPIDKLTRFAGLHCYMVNKRFYQRFLDTRGVNNLDKNLSGNLYLAYPMLALQHDTYSDNVRKMTNYNITHVRKLKIWQGLQQKKNSEESSGSMDIPSAI